jgi:hypothetical protein
MKDGRTGDDLALPLYQAHRLIAPGEAVPELAKVD